MDEAENGTVEQNDAASAQTIRLRNQDIDWGKYGLSEKSHYGPKRTNNRGLLNGNPSPEVEKLEVRELFEEEGELDESQEPWWKSSFFITRTLLFGTWDGVFTSCLMNIVGVVIFLRTGWMIGYAGIGLSILILVLSLLVALASVMSAVGICDRCDIKGGGVYSIVSHVLGGKVGGAIGLLYCLGHAVATAMYCTGFAESFSSVVGWNNTWAIRSIALVVLLALLAIAISGVKWVIRFQLVLVLILAIAVLDFVIGTLVHNPVAGFTGFSSENFNENSKPMFTSHVHFFTVFGVFFPAACGVMSGVNMSGDLKDPRTSIPIGSLAALGVSGAFYLVFIFLLGATCTRDALRNDNMIMQKISVIGFLFLLGLYVSSLSSILGGLVGPPRVLQRIAEDNILPVLKPFAKKRGACNEPQNATFLVAFIAILFILIGKLNTLATIVTMPFLVTYMAINYSYFALAMSYEIKQKRKLEDLDNNHHDGLSYLGDIYKKPHKDIEKFPLIGDVPSYGSQEDEDNVKETKSYLKDAKQNQSEPELQRKCADLHDSSTHESVHEDVSHFHHSKELLVNNAPLTDIEDCGKIENETDDKQQRQLEFVKDKEPTALYSKLCNRWVSLFTAGICIILMFCISWSFALASISITLLMYTFISQSSPGLSLGVSADFSFYKWIRSPWKSQRGGKNERQIVVHKSFVPYGISMYQMTQENSDYAGRDRKHHSSVITKPVPYD